MNIVAHRGFWHPGVAENSHQSIARAIASAIPAIEVDVRLNRNGELFLLHDPYLDRVSGIHRQLRDLDSSQCRQVRLSDGSPLPLLADILAFVANRATICLDVKEPEIAAHIPYLAKERWRLQIWSPHRSVIRAASRAGIPSVMISNGLHLRGIGAFLWGAQDAGANGVSFFPADLEPHVVQLCHHAGIPVQCGTPNDATTWRYLAEHGVQTIVTDRPLECARHLSRMSGERVH